MSGKQIIQWFIYIMLFGILVLGVIYIFPLHQQLSERQDELDLQNKIKSEKQIINNELTAEVNALKSSPEAVEKVAREKYKFIKEDETVMHYEPLEPQR